MRYFIGFLITIGLIFLIIVLLLGGGSKTTNSPASKPLSLVDYADDATSSAQVIIDGPIVADPKHQMLKINVSNNTVTLTTYSGYQQNVVNAQSYANNATAYAIFLKSIQQAGFTLHDTKVGYDERGYCPQGERYIMEFIDNGVDVRRSWTTTCGSSVPSSFKGQLSTILFLFKGQVPDYTQQTQNFQLY